jgi:hypothetical protein
MVLATKSTGPPGVKVTMIFTVFCALSHQAVVKPKTTNSIDIDSLLNMAILASR